MRVVIIGAGATGSRFGAALARAGAQVTPVDRAASATPGRVQQRS